MVISSQTTSMVQVILVSVTYICSQAIIRHHLLFLRGWQQRWCRFSGQEMWGVADITWHLQFKEGWGWLHHCVQFPHEWKLGKRWWPLFFGNSNKTLGNRMELHQENIRLDIRKTYSTERAVRYWKWYP